jgi:acetyl-CoA/propionyl-CoA carboxylase, biotin carboxylase, biotin carboxyl carrier protein
VRAQILTAAEEPLEFTQEDLVLKGAAIECRINAENAGKNFMPAPGRIGNYHDPAGPGVRVDSGAEANFTIPQAYDPMIAKVITYGANREEARHRMLRALGEYEIEGIKTTIPFHRLMLADERFASGDYHTGTVEREMDLSVLAEAPASPPKPGEPEIVERVFEVEVEGKRFSVTARERLETLVQPRKPKPPARVGAGVGGGTDTLVAPMQGTIVKILVAKGQKVKSGEPIVVLEAMKMENSILAHVEGTVEDLKVKEGQSIETGATIAVIR